MSRQEGISGPASAQSAAGSIRGIVADEQGAVFPGVTLTAGNETLPGGRTAVTDSGSNGHSPFNRFAGVSRGPENVTHANFPGPWGSSRDVALLIKVDRQGSGLEILVGPPE